MPDFAPWQWSLGALCAFLVGVAKTGVPGVGILAIPIMVIVAGRARESAAWLLPILCVADVYAVIAWRRHVAAARLFQLAPWVAGGLAAGAAALSFPERIMRPFIGCIILAMLAVNLLRRWRGDPNAPSSHPWPYGLAAGFSSTVANAAGPVMNLYMISMRLPKEEFVATGASLFFFVNHAKIPVYVWHRLFSRESLIFDAALIPVTLLGAYFGRWVVRVIPQRVFEMLVLAMTCISTLLLFR